jgi:hypothetical protein
VQVKKNTHHFKTTLPSHDKQKCFRAVKDIWGHQRRKYTILSVQKTKGGIKMHRAVCLMRFTDCLKGWVKVLPNIILETVVAA